MPCDDQRRRKQDKKDAYDIALVAVGVATAAALAADIAMYIACGAAVGTAGGLAPACIVAIAALAAAIAAEAGAITVSEISRKAYITAKGEYDECMSKLRPAKQ